MVEQQARDRKVADPWFDSRTGNVPLCPWERHFTLISIGAKQSTCCGGRHDERLAQSLIGDCYVTEPKKVLCASMVRQMQGAD